MLNIFLCMLFLNLEKKNQETESKNKLIINNFLIMIFLNDEIYFVVVKELKFGVEREREKKV